MRSVAPQRRRPGNQRLPTMAAMVFGATVVVFLLIVFLRWPSKPNNLSATLQPLVMRPRVDQHQPALNIVSTTESRDEYHPPEPSNLATTDAPISTEAPSTTSVVTPVAVHRTKPPHTPVAPTVEGHDRFFKAADSWHTFPANIFAEPIRMSPHNEMMLPLDKLMQLHDAIATLYHDVPELPASDPLWVRFNSDVFSGRQALTNLLGRWVMLNRLMRNGKRPARMVSVNPVGQLCNRLMAISSGFVFAFVTGRGLHIDDTGFYCALSDLFEMPGFDWVNFGTADVSDAHLIQNPESGVWEETEPLLCADYSTAYKHRSITMSINQYLVPYIVSNPKYRTSFRHLFGSFDIFTPIARFLFQPIPMLIKMRDEYVSNHFHGHFVVGLQVRTGADFTDHFMTSADWVLYKHCGEAITPITQGGKLKYFVATDTAQGRDAAKKEIGGSIVMFGPGDFKLSNDPPGVQMALLDLLLLAAADDRITTAWSSYGYFAAGYSGKPAAMVVDRVNPSLWVAKTGEEQRFMGVAHKSDARRQCVRLPLHQPCFHKYASWGADKATCFNQRWYEREMMNGRYC